MNQKLNPLALKALRKRRGWTQEQLSEKSKISKAQVSRWERGKSLEVHESSRKRLTRALGTTWDELTRSPTRALDHEEESATARLNVRISVDIRNALEIVSQRYGVKPSDIVETAPLLFFIVAERSLDERRARLGEIESAVENLKELFKSAAPHLGDELKLPEEESNFEHALLAEREAIDRQDLFSPNLAEYDVEEIDPFVNSLTNLVTESAEEACWFGPSIVGGVPNYCFKHDFIRRAVGFPEPIDEKDENKQRSAASFIATGTLDVREVFERRKNLSDEEFRLWVYERQEEVGKELLEEDSLAQPDHVTR